MDVITVLFLGPARQLAGTARTQLALPDDRSLLTLKAMLHTAHPALADALPAIRFAVNGEFASDARELLPGDEVALIPPVSGG